VGTFGDAACFSFETSKIINTMGGGMVVVRDPELGARIREAAGRESRNGLRWVVKRLVRTSFEAGVTNPLLFNLGVYQALRLAVRSDGRDRFASGYHGDEVSMTGKMGRYTNYQARLGLNQMRAVAGQNARRLANAQRLIGRLRERVRFQEPAAPDVKPNYMLVTSLVPQLSEVSARLLRAGVDTKHLYMRDCSRMFGDSESFPNAARAEREVLHLPAYRELSDGQIDTVAETLSRVLGELGMARTD
jgi:dTDP-4-amino-4,6-dideoxygalactose transaminase